MTILYLIRHGETAGNSEGRFQGIVDNPLNESGMQQSQMLGMAFSLSRVDVLYTSPLLRARQTAQMIAQMHGLQKLEPVVEPGLSELDGGLLEGRRFDELAVEYPQVMQAMYHAPAQLCCPGGESMKQLSERIVQTVDRIVRQNQGKVIVAVSHGTVSYTHLTLPTNREV